MNVEDDEGDLYEAVEPEQTFNPVLQHFYDCLISKAID